MAAKEALLASGYEDRISSLPDDVICHILSFLPTKYSVCTRVLSTRWKHLFSFIPTLDFVFYSSNSYKSSRFMNGVNSVFNVYKASRMDKFHLRIWSSRLPSQDYPIVSWIFAAIRRHVKELDIDIRLQTPLTMPVDLVSCKTLTSLTLSPDLPCLRTCILERVCFDNESARRLFRSFPSLEHLELIMCRVAEGVELLDISSPTLKHLTIWKSEDKYLIGFNLPNLLYFSYICLSSFAVMSEIRGLESLKSVVEARICYEQENVMTKNNVVDLVRALCHVQKLSLTGDTMEAFIRSGNLLPKFNNLTSLAVNRISSSVSVLLPSLLDNSPQLEYLSFYMETENKYVQDHRVSYSSQHVPVCVARHLKEVEFINFTGLDYERKLINYLLKYGKSLKKMKIWSKLNWNGNLRSVLLIVRLFFMILKACETFHLLVRVSTIRDFIRTSKLKVFCIMKLVHDIHLVISGV